MKYIDLLLKLFLIVDFFFIKFYLTYLKDTLTQIHPKESSQTQTRVEILTYRPKITRIIDLADHQTQQNPHKLLILLSQNHTNPQSNLA